MSFDLTSYQRINPANIYLFKVNNRNDVKDGLFSGVFYC